VDKMYEAFATCRLHSSPCCCCCCGSRQETSRTV